MPGPLLGRGCLRFDSCKRPPPISDHSVFAFWVVAYGRFDCFEYMTKYRRIIIVIIILSQNTHIVLSLPSEAVFPTKTISRKYDVVFQKNSLHYRRSRLRQHLLISNTVVNSSAKIHAFQSSIFEEMSFFLSANEPVVLKNTYNGALTWKK